jgi:hypothetical protein
MEIAPFKEYGIFKRKKRIRGVLAVTKEGVTRVAWSDKVVYEIDPVLLPPFQIPGIEKTTQCILKYEIDPLNCVLTLHDGNHDYVFHRQNPTNNDKDTFVKLLVTQLLFDQIIKHL